MLWYLEMKILLAFYKSTFTLQGNMWGTSKGAQKKKQLATGKSEISTRDNCMALCSGVKLA